MKIFFLTLAIFTCINLSVLAAEYSSVIDDLPLMPGMTEKADDTVSFDKPNGRIVDAVAETRATATAVVDFYRQALPPLGWVQQQGGNFIRNGETLKIETEQEGESTVVHFNITPREEGK